MWLHHLLNLFGRSWSGTVNAYGTTTLGFVLWTLLLAAFGWFAGVAAAWIKLWRGKTPHPLRAALSSSILAGVLSATGILVILISSYVFFFIRTVYRDHQSLVSHVAALDKANADLMEQLELRKHGMVANEPVFTNTISLLMAFDSYRHAQKGKPCVIMITAPSDSNMLPSIVGQFSNSVSDCTTFGPMISSIDPDVEKRARDGMVPNKVVFHAARDNRPADRLFTSLGNLIQLQRSYDLPSPAERTHLYRIPTPGQEDLVWLQFGTDVRWNEQLR
jgi:hypothetical protein